MEDAIRLSLVSSGGLSWEKQVSSVTLPAEFGSLGILRGHAPMLCAVKKGVLRCRFGEGESLRLMISDGIANVADNEVTLLLSDFQVIE